MYRGIFRVHRAKHQQKGESPRSHKKPGGLIVKTGDTIAMGNLLGKYRKTLVWIGILMVLVGGVYFGLKQILTASLESYVRQNLPEALETKDISFNLLPVTVDLEQPRLRAENRETLKAESIRVNPSIGSLFGDTFVIDSLEFEGISLTFYRRDASDTINTLPPEITSLVSAGGEGSANFKINRIKLSQAKIQLMESPASDEPILDLSPIELSFGPITPHSLKRGIELNATSGLSGSEEIFFLRAGLRYGKNLEFNGDLRFKDLSPDRVSPLLEPGLEMTEGTLRGSLSFDYNSQRLTIPSIQLRLEDSKLTLTGEQNQSDPELTSARAAPTAVELPLETEEEFRTSVGDVQLELLNTRFDFSPLIGEPTIPPVFVQDGLIKAGPYDSSSPVIPIIGQLMLNKPGGLIELRTELNLTASEWSLDKILSDLRIDDVNELNPYLETVLPIRLRSGVMVGGIKGRLARNSMNLAVELDFDKLKMRSGKTEGSRFLGVPVSIYLNYLSKNDGNLELSFKINGSPASPKVEISNIRNRILVNLGVDAAVLTSVGLPVYVGDKVVEKVTGYSIINEAKSTLSRFFKAPKNAEDPPKLKSETVRPKTAQPKKTQ